MKFVKGKSYTINVDGSFKLCNYLGYECGADVFEVVGTTLLVYKTNTNNRG